MTENNKPKHTPLPWRVSAGLYVKHDLPGGLEESIADAYPGRMLEAPHNAAFIVRACNAHYELVEALENLLAEPARSDGTEDQARVSAVRRRARAALARVKEGK